MTAERYLEKQVKLTLTPPITPLHLDSVALKDAPMKFRERLNHILYSNLDEGGGQRTLIGKTVNETVDINSFHSDISTHPGHMATIIGSAQQGKTSMLNALLNLFGFSLKGGLSINGPDLLPSESKDQIGLPFPLRLEYGSKYQIHGQRWLGEELEGLMSTVAEKVLEENVEFFDDVNCGLQELSPGSFLEFVVEHGAIHEANGGYYPSNSASIALEANGGSEVIDFSDEPFDNPSIDAHKAITEYLKTLVEKGDWFRYKHVTLKCPSELLKHLFPFMDNIAAQTRVLDLPGCGIVNDNNLLVEELVLRDVRDADTIIVLTGQRSFTQDVLCILRNSVFHRLLDPSVVPPPTVAVTNSHFLCGLMEDEMDSWRSATLEGDMGWNKEIGLFAEEMFGNGKHRELSAVQPELFPNDLTGFIDSQSGADEKGVSMLVGYFLRLPQESLVAQLTHVLERASSINLLLDRLWKANKGSRIQIGSSSPRLSKEAKRLQEEEFQKHLDSCLTLALQKDMFNFEMEPLDGSHKVLNRQLDYIDSLFKQQLGRLYQKFSKIKNKPELIKQDLLKMVKELLIHVASQWDENVGHAAFESFLESGRQLSYSIFEKWARKTFNMDSREVLEDPSREQACKYLAKHLSETARNAINGSNFIYTWTHGLRQQAWNLDLKDILKFIGARKSQRNSANADCVWSLVEDLIKAKLKIFKDQMMGLMSLRSDAIKKLVDRLKKEITKIFLDGIKNYGLVMNALESISLGKVAASKDPLVCLRDDLGKFTSDLERYLEGNKKVRNGLGAQELKRLIRPMPSPTDSCTDLRMLKRPHLAP